MKEKIINPFGFIYITTNMINGKRYIGQKRFESGKHRYDWEIYLGSGKLLKQAIKKYGKENFYRDIVAIAYSEKELDRLEIEWINDYDAIKNNSFYNIAEGGHAGNKFAGLSNNRRKEIGNKISKSNKGENCFWYGRHHDDKTKQKMKQNHYDAKGKNSPCSIKVVCITTKLAFYSIAEAERYYDFKIGKSTISKCCNGEFTKSGKLKDGTPLKWKYYDDLTESEKIEYVFIIDTIENKL